MVAEGFYKPICFNPALVYLIAGFLIGLSLKYYLEITRARASPNVRAVRSHQRRRRR